MKTVLDVQTRLREADAALYEDVKRTIGEKQTFAYSYLAPCAAFAGMENLDTFTPEVRRFAVEVVTPVVKECLDAMEKSQAPLDDSTLKGSLLKALDRVQFYPKKVDFEVTRDPALFQALDQNGISKVEGRYVLYKLKADDARYYGGRIEIEPTVFSQIARTFESCGYKDVADKMGSAADGCGHISTIDPRSLATYYDAIVSAHKDRTVVISIEGAKIGRPQSGRLAHMVAAVVKVDSLAEYRISCGLPPMMQFAPHITLFSRDIQPLESLNGRSLVDFTNASGNALLTQLGVQLKQRKTAVEAPQDGKTSTGAATAKV